MPIETRLAETFPLAVNFFQLEYINVANNGPKGPRNGKDIGVSLLLIPLLPSGRRKRKKIGRGGESLLRDP